MSARVLTRLVVALALGLGTAVLVSCGGSGKGLIPAADAGPLQHDFEAVSRVAREGNCAGTETALSKTESDFHSLPASVDKGLLGRLTEGIDNLRHQALALCEQPLVNTDTSTSATVKTNTQTSSTQTTTQTTTTSTQTTPTVTTDTQTTTPPPPGGGTQAPGESPSEGTEAPRESHEPNQGPGSSGGTGQGNQQ